MGTTILRGGRVIDPASGTEAVADVVVRGDRVARVSPGPVLEPEATVIDVTGLVVGPGFVICTAMRSRSPGSGCRPSTA